MKTLDKKIKHKHSSKLGHNHLGFKNMFDLIISSLNRKNNFRINNIVYYNYLV